MGKKRPIIAIALITAVCLAGDSMLYIVLPIHWKSVGLSSLVEVGVLLSINRFVRLPLNPLIGFIYTRINFRKGILFATILGGATTISYGIADNFWIWLLSRSLWGVAWSLFKLGAFFLLLDLSSEFNRGNLMGTYNGLYRIGSLFGMLLGGILVDLFGMLYISVALGIMALASIPFIVNYIPRTITIQQQQKGSIYQIFKDSKIAWIFLTAFLGYLFLEGMFNATLSHMIDHRLTTTYLIGAASIAGVLQASRWLVLTVISSSIGGLVDNVYRKEKILAIFFVLAALLFILLTLEIPFMFWIPCVFLHLLVASSLTTIVDVVVSGVASEHHNKIMIMTAYTMVVDFGAAFGPILGYILEDRIGLSQLFWLSSLVCLLLTIKWILPISKKMNAQH